MDRHEGEGGGLNRYDGEKDCFIRFHLIDPDSAELELLYIRTLMGDHAGYLWISYYEILIN